MSYCPNCGERLETIDYFCPYCQFRFDDRLKSDNKNLIIQSLQNRIKTLENQIYKPQYDQIRELRNEVQILKHRFLSNPKPVKNKKEGEIWYIFCVGFVVIIFIYYLITIFSRM